MDIKVLVDLAIEDNPFAPCLWLPAALPGVLYRDTARAERRRRRDLSQQDHPRRRFGRRYRDAQALSTLP